MESRSFPSNFDIARGYAEHRAAQVLYATRNGVPSGSGQFYTFKEEDISERTGFVGKTHTAYFKLLKFDSKH